MANARRLDMTADEFLVWNLTQDERFELVDGVPVPLRAMAGATDAHDTIVVNLIVALGNQLEGTLCRPKTADTASRTAIARIRRPDVSIECSAVVSDSQQARNPLAGFEILSPTTRKMDRTLKLHEYMRHPSLKVIVHIDPDVMDVLVFTRGADGQWDPERLQQRGGYLRDAAIRPSCRSQSAAG